MSLSCFKVNANEHEQKNGLEIDAERAQGWEIPQKIILDPEYQS